MNKKTKTKKRSVKSPIQKKDLMYVASGVPFPKDALKKLAAAVSGGKKHNNIIALVAYEESDGTVINWTFSHNAKGLTVRSLVSHTIKEFDLIPPELSNLIENINGIKKQP